MPAKSHSANAFAMRTARIPAAAYALAGILAVIGSNAFALSAIAPAIAETWGMRGPDVMVAATGYGLGTATSALFLTGQIDRFGNFRCLRIAAIVFAGALLLGAAATSVAMLAVSQFIAGAAVGVAVPAIYAGCLTIAPHGKESRTIGVALGGWTLSLMAGVGVASLLTQWVNWRAVFAVNAVASGLTVLAMLRLKDTPSKAAPAPALASPLGALRISGIRPLLAACTAAMAAFYGLYAYLGDYIHHGLGQPLIVNGVATFLYGAGFGAATLIDGMVDRLGARRLLPAAFLLGAGVYAALALGGRHLAAVLAGFLVLGLVNHLQVNLLVTRLTGTEPNRKGAVLGLNTAVTYFGMLAGTASFAPIYSAFGFRAAAGVSAGLMLVASAFLIRRQPEHGITK